MPEPWATRLVLEGGGKVLVDEADLWPDGEFVTTHLIVATDVPRRAPRRDHGDLIAGLADAIDVANADPRRPRTTVNAGIERITTKPLGDETIAGAWENLTLHARPDRLVAAGSADDAIAVGLLEPVDLADPGIYDLTLLNEVLAERGETDGRRGCEHERRRAQRGRARPSGRVGEAVHRAPRRRPRRSNPASSCA